MDISKELALAVEEAGIKRAVAALTGRISPTARRRIYLELLADDDAILVAPATQTILPMINGGGVSAPTSTPLGPTAKAVAILAATPGGMKAPELAERIYGNVDKKVESRMRTVLWTLKKQNRIVSLGNGNWGIKK